LLVTRDFHYKWSKSHKPVLHARPGDKVKLEIHNTSSDQISEKTKSEDIPYLDTSKFYPLTGPIFVEGAKKGDTLIVRVLGIKTVNWGISVIMPGYGLLEEFNRPFIWHWNLRNRTFTPFKNGIRVPLRPFCGVMGVAPAEAGFFEVMPPSMNGGNLDIKHLTVGSELRLPVLADGALFSAGDMHAAQGDGEVCVSAIETHGALTVEFGLVKGKTVRGPQYYSRPETQPRGGYFATTGIAPDLMSAAKEAVRSMVEELVARRDLTPDEAYVLCSVAADLRIHEVVDRPNWVVGAMISQEILGRSRLGRKTVT
jgi:acetamidase/formamidase